MDKRVLTKDIKKINEEISDIQNLLRESFAFCEEDEPSMEEPVIDGEPSMEEPVMDDEVSMEEPIKGESSIDSYIDHIRKYSLNGLSALCDNPESEEYQMLKKIFQMCDKKPEKKEGVNESHRIFGLMKGTNKVILETYVKSGKELKDKKRVIAVEARKRGINPTNIRLVSENKIII